MFCPFCGTDNKTATKFCGGCGQLIPEESVSVPLTPKTHSDQKPVYNKKFKAPAQKSNIKPIFSKNNIITAIFYILQALLYSAICVHILLLPKLQDAIIINTVSSKGKPVSMLLTDFVNLMLNGNRLFNPTIPTTAFATGISVFIYCIPVFAVICLLGSVIRKKSGAFNATFTIISLLSEAFVALAIPVSVYLCPEFKNAIALNINFVIDDVGTIDISKIIIYCAVSAGITVVAAVITAIAAKWRNKK